MRKNAPRLTDELISQITQRYDTDELLVSNAYNDGGTEHLRGRLEGGLLNQMEGGDAMASRYAIWANTVRDNILVGIQALKAGEKDTGYVYLVRAANSLSAFSEAQAYLDPLNLGSRS